MKDDRFEVYKHALLSEDFTKIWKSVDKKYNASHNFKIVDSKDDKTLCIIHFQEGPTKEVGINGIFMPDLLGICLSMLEDFQSTEFKCRENALAITAIEEAILRLKQRQLERKKRGVQGTYKK